MIKSKRIYLANLMLALLPNTSCQLFKTRILRWAGVKVGKGVRIFQGAKIQGVGDVELGDRAFIGHDALLMVNEGGKIILKPRAGVSSRVIIMTGYHSITPNGERILSKEGTTSIVTIGYGCSVSAGSIVLPGVTVGEMSIVAAGSVVTKDVEAYTMVAGVPAVFKKKLKND